MRRVLQILSVIAGLTTAPEAHSWSLETHLYIGSRVLSDIIDDGAISLCVGSGQTATPPLHCSRTYDVPPTVVSALRSHPGAFLAGTLGPDVYPDFVTAQVTVHPGVANAWQTDDWLRHLLQNAQSSAEIAWVSGYLSHAAGDIFAHTWVNQYSGDIFDLKVHSEVGNEVELRHFTLERYVADRTPRHWEPYGSPRAPLDFIADHLILSNATATQYKRASIPAHLVAIEGLHENVGRVHDEAVRLKSKIFEIGLRELSPLRQAEQALQITEAGLKAAQESAKAAETALAWRDQKIREAEDKLVELARIIDENPGLISTWRLQIEAAKASIAALEAAAEQARRLFASAEAEVNRLREVLNATTQFETRTLCKIVSLGGLIPGLGELCEEVREVTAAWSVTASVLRGAEGTLAMHRQALEGALRGISLARDRIDELDRLIRNAEKEITDARLLEGATRLQVDLYRRQREFELKTLNDARAVLAKAEQEVARARQKVAELNGKLAPVADLLARYDPLVLFLAKWRDGIRDSAAAFAGASQTVAELIVNKSGESRLEPYRKWFECWTPVLVSVPSEVPLTICTLRDEFLAMKDKFDKELNDFVDRLGAFGWLLAPNIKLQQEFDKKVRQPLEKEVRGALGKVRDEILTFLANRQLAELVRLMDSSDPITDAKLNGIFQTDDSRTSLLPIADIAARVRADAGLGTEEAQVSEDRFAALYNAIVLSKLSLIGPSALNAIHRDLTGREGSVFGRTLYPETTGGFSLLLDAVRSIDGNHQWQAVALPYPRTNGIDGGWPNERRYGRSLPSGDSGFRFWGDRDARVAVFKKIFRGPLNPGLEDHPVMVASYPFPACAANPFPSTTNASGQLILGDRTCSLVADSARSGLPGSFSVLSIRRVPPAEIAGLSRWDLRVARNEIFARNGLRFGPPELEEHFLAQTWYRPTDRPLAEINRALTTLEWRNIAAIQRLEKRSRTMAGRR